MLALLVPVLVAAGPRLAAAAPPEPPSTETDTAQDPPANEPESTPPREPLQDPPREPPAAGPTAAEVRALRERLDALQHEVDELRARDAPNDVAPPPPAATPAAAAAPDAVPDPAAADPEHNRPPEYADGFHFGSYGRVVAAGDHRGRAPRDADIVAHGSRLDESTYVELELRREDYWPQAKAYTRIVSTLAIAHPIFHYTGKFALSAGMRNLYLEESGVGLKKLSVWVGSRMYRGDDIYLLNFWPLDNLNTVGGGASYTFLKDLTVKIHTGLNQPDSPFFYQAVARPRPLLQQGEAQVEILNRQKIISSARVSNIFGVGKRGGVKPIAYGELHYTNEGQRETTPRTFESVPRDIGYVVGVQLGAFTGTRSTHLNLIARYASGLAAYGEFNAPTQLSPQRDSKGAREVLLAAGGNYEVGPFGLLLGTYWRTFRNASPRLDFDDLSEGVVILRPTVWLGKIAGVSVEGSYQAQRRGALVESDDGAVRPVFGQMGRIGVMPFLSPGGRGNFTRPHLRFTYLLTMRNAGARAMSPEQDIFAIRKTDHFFGLSAEWWFGSTSYFRD